MITRLSPPTRPAALLATADIETSSDGKLLDINLAWREANGNEVYLTGQSWPEFFDMCKGAFMKAGGSIIRFHNGGGFDYVDLTLKLLLGDFKDQVEKFLPIMVGPTIIALEMKIIGARRRIILADSMKLFPGLSLKFLCSDKGFNLPIGKEEVPGNYIDHMEDYRRDFPVAYHSYHKRDTLALLEILHRFQKMLNDISPIGGLKLTLGSIAMAIFRTTFLDYDIVTPGRFEADFTSKGFQGGRTEFVGQGLTIDGKTYRNINIYDQNSQYPYMMTEFLYPTLPGTHTKDPSMMRLPSGLIRSGVYRVTYKQTSGRIAYLKPFIDEKRANEAAWEGDTYATHIELNKLETCGTVVLHEGIVYEEECMQPIFKRFVDTLYALRLAASDAGNVAMVLVIKLIMNNLYGKFGQREENTTLRILTHEQEGDLADNPKTISIRSRSDIAEDVFAVTEYSMCAHRFPSIAAFVTAHARMHVLSVGNDRGIDITYMDTDSIHTQQKLPADLCDQRRMGAFKLEKASQSMVYGGRKIYIYLDEKDPSKIVKCKGAPKKNIVPDAFSRALRMNLPYTVHFKSPSSLKMALRLKCDRANEFRDYKRIIQADTSSVQKGLTR